MNAYLFLATEHAKRTRILLYVTSVSQKEKYDKKKDGWLLAFVFYILTSGVSELRCPGNVTNARHEKCVKCPKTSLFFLVVGKRLSMTQLHTVHPLRHL